MTGNAPGITLTKQPPHVEKSDDLDILITNGNLFYENARI